MPQSNQPRNSATNTMLIDATHPEETRVVVLKNGRVEEFDYESAARKLLRGNIYLAKVTRVEPSLQAAFVDYGGNRHGFLAFNEIHPDYYQIPIADRRALIEAEAAAEAEEEAEVERAAQAASQRHRRGHQRRRPDDEEAALDVTHLLPPEPAGSEQPRAVSEPGAEQPPSDFGGDAGQPRVMREDVAADPQISAEPSEPVAAGPSETHEVAAAAAPQDTRSDAGEHAGDETRDSASSGSSGGDVEAAPTDAPHAIGMVEEVGVSEIVEVESGNGGEAEQVETVVSEDALEELPSRPRRRLRSYKIQEVIKRRQVILVQVVKEERGTKGAALTTYLSLAGRYTVLMPNTARGGGISRKITNAQDRKRLKAIAEELEVEEGMGLIIRTAGAARTKQEIKRDYEYLLRLWESVRDVTLASVAPTLVYEEGNLIKRSIRDLYGKEVEEVMVAGAPAFAEAQDFMRMLMPSHAKNVVEYKGAEPLFTRYQIERQLNALFSPYVHLRSGGYLVINQTEALVAIDINSGKSTREFSIEETALNTNLEAADEIARQLKLRDLAGLIVIDFIDMEEKRNNRSVERRLKDALRFDRARIQVGRISHFGLMEMSRQRLRTGVLEGSTSQCPHCQGTGIIRSTESVALAVLRGLEDALMTGQPSSLIATTTPTVALYILNQKRNFITDMESRCGITVHVIGSDKMQGANFSIERMARREEPQRRQESTAVSMDWGFEDDAGGEPETDAATIYPDSDGEEETARADRGGERDRDRDRDREGNGEGRRRRRRRRGRGRREEGGMQAGERGHRHEHGDHEGRHEGQENGYDGEHGDEPSEPRDRDYAEAGLEEVGGFDPGVEPTGDHDADGGADERADAGEGGRGQGQGEGRGRRGRRRGRRGGRRGERGDRPIREGGEQPLAGAGEGIGNGHASVDEAESDAPAAVEPRDVGGAPDAAWQVQPAPEYRHAEAEHTHAVAREDTAPAWQPAPAIADPVPSRHETDLSETQRPEPEAAAPVAVAEPEPVATTPVEPMPDKRRQPVASEPVLERVVVGAGEAAVQAEEPRPARRGWWRR